MTPDQQAMTSLTRFLDTMEEALAAMQHEINLIEMSDEKSLDIHERFIRQPEGFPKTAYQICEELVAHRYERKVA